MDQLFRIELTQPVELQWYRLRDRDGSRDFRELIARALTFYEWALNHTNAGRQLKLDESANIAGDVSKIKESELPNFDMISPTIEQAYDAADAIEKRVIEFVIPPATERHMSGLMQLSGSANYNGLVGKAMSAYESAVCATERSEAVVVLDPVNRTADPYKFPFLAHVEAKGKESGRAAQAAARVLLERAARPYTGKG